MQMTAQDARRRFAGAQVATLATVTPAGRPHVVPFTFAVDGDVVYTAVDAKPKSTTALQRLRNLRANPEVALLADHYSDDWSELWWARADGHATVLDQPDAMGEPVRLLSQRYAQYQLNPPGGPVIMITVHRWTGWQASPP
jgi:PPOX class probable F420-dependent enzyme